MPVEHCGFKLKASGFFNNNPSTDLPPESNRASVQTGGCCGGKKASSPN